MLISIEGIDNVGKTTISKHIVEILRSKGHEVILVSDPPLVPPWQELKTMMTGASSLAPTARALLMLTARVDGFQRVISPALKKDQLVISDRYIDSWYAYQMESVEKDLGNREQAFSFLQSIEEPLIDRNLIIYPDKTFLVIADPSETIKRGLSKPASIYDTEAFQRKVQENFSVLAVRDPKRIEIVDSMNSTLKEIENRLTQGIIGLLS